MKIESYVRTFPCVATPEAFEAMSTARQANGKLANHIVAIPYPIIDRIREHLEEIAEGADESAFDSDGKLEMLSDEEPVDELLSFLFDVFGIPSKWRVTVEFVVEADTATDAERTVSDTIGHTYSIEDWDIVQTTEED